MKNWKNADLHSEWHFVHKISVELLVPYTQLVCLIHFDPHWNWVSTAVRCHFVGVCFRRTVFENIGGFAEFHVHGGHHQLHIKSKSNAYCISNNGHIRFHWLECFAFSTSNAKSKCVLCDRFALSKSSRTHTIYSVCLSIKYIHWFTAGKPKSLPQYTHSELIIVSRSLLISPHFDMKTIVTFNLRMAFFFHGWHCSLWMQ